MALKGVALTLQYVAWDTANNVGKTGDNANHTLKVIKDGTAATPTNSPAEVDATNCPGVYKLALTAAEMGYSVITLAGKSSTTGIVIIPVTVTTEGGNLDATVSSRAPEAAGNVAAIKTQTDKFAFTVANQVDANVLKIGGTIQTGRDIGASVLLSPGTGTGQLDITSGVVKANLVQILAAAITGTAAQIVAAFTKWFNVATPIGTVNSLPDAVAGAAGGLAVETGGNLAAVKAKTDNLPASPAAVGSAMALTSAYDSAKTAAPESGGNVAAIKAKTDNLPAAPAATGDIPSAATIAAAVWGASTRTLSSFGTLVADIWANATRTLSSFGTLAADVWGVATRAITDKAGFTISGTKQTLDALQDLSQVGAQAGATAALNAYDPPTKAEMDAGLAALNDISVADILAGNLADSQSFSASTLADLIRKIFWMVASKMVVVDANGNYTLYKSDGVTVAATGSIVDDATNTTRSGPAWQ